MKKSLLAIAAMTAFAGAAQAQSSVTVYGIMDMGYSNASGTTTQDGVETKLNTASTGTQSNQTTSRLGFKGVEDLGGGVSALFTYELGLNDFGQSGASSLSNRVQFVGLADKKLGTVLLGRQYESIHSVIGNGSAGAQNNVVGTIYSGASAVGSAVTRPYAVYIDNAITYVSPNFAGLTLELQTGSATTSTSQTSGTSGGTETGGSLKYSGVKNLSVGYGMSVKGAVTAGSSDTKTTTQALSANYNFGKVQPFLLATITKVDNNASGINLSDMKLYEAGVRAPVTPKIGVWASVMTGNIGSGSNATALAKYSLTAANAHGDVSGFQLGTAYNFSKRTNLYAIYGQQSVKGKDGAVNDKLATSQYALGLRHKF